MTTLLLTIDPADLAGGRSALERAAQILRAGGTVAFPTETVYGLGANACDESAVRRIFEAKQRPAWDPLIVHIARIEELAQVAGEVSATERSLVETYWPGPLTLLLPKGPAIPSLVTAGRAKVGVRMPAHPVARALIELAGVPVAAPSANSFGRISPTTAQHVLEDLDGRIDAILDGGPTTLGLESTVLDASVSPPTLYRHGMVSIEELRRLLPGLVAFDESALAHDAEPAALPSPGVGLRHYAPRAELELVEGEDLRQALQQAIDAAAGKRLGVLLPDDFQIKLPVGVAVVRWGRWDHQEELAQRLFAGLRTLDAFPGMFHVELILCPLPASAGIGAALRDRLRKATKSGT